MPSYEFTACTQDSVTEVLGIMEMYDDADARSFADGVIRDLMTAPIAAGHFIFLKRIVRLPASDLRMSLRSAVSQLGGVLQRRSASSESANQSGP
jgi:hypothetical protein